MSKQQCITVGTV